MLDCGSEQNSKWHLPVGRLGNICARQWLHKRISLAVALSRVALLDKKVVKRILKEGEGYEKPNDGTVAKVKVIGSSQYF
ncbi:hypothetical protein MKW98_028364 [Papaver atlanticum]|uniref:Uncharacterized protein n=1 Tax=Papaver atlanticum TaxID=357466 RepID=A0AAD4XLY8_9MAGN|nr:hypothetical protein MKW98_028364 [Papaver atlanticum]